MTGTGFSYTGKVKTASHYTRVVVASLLVLVTLVNITFAWIDREREGNVHPGSYISVSADGIMMETTDGVMLDTIRLEDVCEELTECSSIDGRNIYFPVTDPSSDNAPIRFRKADVNDRNSKYMCLEFRLTSDKDTDVWISNESYILGSATDAVRVSIDFPTNSGPVVLDGSDGRPTTSTYAVEYIDSDGVAYNDVQTSSALGKYFYTAYDDTDGNFIAYSDNELFSLKAGVTENVVLTVWLEGADPECDIDVYEQTDLQINLRFTTEIKEPRILRFSDFTYESWACIKDIQNICDGETFESFQANARRRVFMRDMETKKLYAMVCEQSSEEITSPSTAISDFYHWTVTVPSSVTNVEFIRLDYMDGYSIGASDAESKWEFWEAGQIKKNTAGRLYLRYYALESGSKGSDNKNHGRWANKSNIVTVYFADNRPESCDTYLGYKLHFSYYTDPNEDDVRLKMTYVGKLESGQNLYAARIPANARTNFFFEQSAHGFKYTGTRSNVNYNLFTVTHDFAAGTNKGSWSRNTSAIYPIT